MKRFIHNAAGLLLFLAGFLIIWHGLRYALVDDTEDYNRFTFHDFYNQKNIDVLFVGSSHSWKSVNPAIIDQELQLNTFNVGKDSQELDGSLMAIKEAVKNYNIKQVYLELFYGLGGYTKSKRVTLEPTYRLADYLKPSISKYLYMLQASNSQLYIYSFFPMRRNWESLYDLDHIQTTQSIKSSESYMDADLDNFYVGKGFGTNSNQIEGSDLFYKANHIYYRSIQPNIYTEGDWKEDLFKIIDFCKENQVELILYSSPISAFPLSSVKNYDDYIAIVHSLLEGTGVPYWDFNLCKEEFFSSNDYRLFSDGDHLNDLGSKMFSQLFARFIKGDITPEALFYETAKEKLSHMAPNVFGITYRLTTDENSTSFRSCSIITTPTEGMEYRITIHPDEGEAYRVQDFAENKVFPLTENGSGKIVIRWRMKEQPKITGIRVVDFPKQ